MAPLLCLQLLTSLCGFGAFSEKMASRSKQLVHPAAQACPPPASDDFFSDLLCKGVRILAHGLKVSI
jgi:hypothetical protein